jgi:coenzyme F420 hydrogenase subunit beta
MVNKYINIAQVIDKDYCIGCGLCVSIVGNNKLMMVENKKGFLIPVPINGFDGEVPNLNRFCPGITVVLNQKLLRKDEKIYGPLLEIKEGYANDEHIRYKGSSGGLITAIACGLLDNDLIDGVLQIASSKSYPTISEYTFSKTTNQVINNAGSRYAPASLLIDLIKILEENSNICVIGKPCDIVGVSQFIEIFPEYKDKVFCKLSFLCMGLPSQNATKQLLKSMGLNDNNEVQFLKYRGDGWPGKVKVTTKNKEFYSCTYEESWGNILGKNIHFRCKICPDGWGSFADISAGDAWYSDGKKPLFNENLGKSLVFIRSKLGEKLLNELDEYISLYSYDIKQLSIIQHSQFTRKNRIWILYLIIKLTGDKLLHFSGLGIWSRIFKVSPIFICKTALRFTKKMIIKCLESRVN